MRLRDPKIWLASVSLVLVTFLVVVDLEHTSPGPLSAAHVGIEDIDERSCELCHGEGDVSLADACNACHEPIAEQLASGDGFHGALEGAASCGRCHAEHHGDELLLAGPLAFKLAGFDPRETYAHESLAFTLTGKHQYLDCAACHERADVAVLAAGERRFIGASQDCASCHEDPHEGRMVKSCESCHGQAKPFTDLDGFVHTEDFPLTGVHALESCTDCHAPNTDHAVEALGGHDAPPARDCAACHEQPHTDPFIRSVAALLEVSAGASCESCHTLDRPTFAEADLDATERLHAASGFALELPHEQLDCSSCHDPSVLAGRDTQRSADECAACHDSPHGEQFDTGPFAQLDCLGCHARVEFTPSLFDAALHAQTAFPLLDSHAGPACTECHLVPAGGSLGALEFAATSSECVACHDDAHTGAFARPALGSRATDDCGACHATTHFADVVPASFDHGVWTIFDLDGAHADASCEACHERSAQPDALGRRFGRVEALFGKPTTDCATCHANVHVGAMTTRSTSCSDCHDTQHFSDVDRAAFDHAGATDFALVGAHARATCEQCHAPRPEPDLNRRAFGLASETFEKPLGNCASCHEDVHKGRFDRYGLPTRVDGATSCARCHDEESFRGSGSEGFDHALWTKFPLEGAHATASCESCHENADRTQRYISPPKDCASCHEDSHYGQFGGAQENACERCHASSASFAELVFDHQTDSRFALDAEHRALDCAACHKPWPLANGGEAVRYMPLGVECADCHLGGTPR
ncbi:MAG: hypothetical protein H6831_03820 [Planctomycetes bacterium]|nr:hypothetical protein [Planctomycetota bacterium]